MLKKFDQKRGLLELAASLRAAELINQGESGRSLELLEDASILLPESARMNYNRGVALAAARKYDEAIEAYQKAIQLGSESPEAFNNLGAAFAAKGADHFED